MATRDDVKQDFIPSPRVSVVDFPSVEFVVQDIVDTLRIREESFRGQSEFRLLAASGKESLGGGVSVGITVELQDNLIAFEGRTTPAETGTVTTSSSPAVSGKIQLIDINALFITSLIERGSLVINYTDMSISEVHCVDSETQLTTKTLVNGTSNTFTLGDNYDVFRIIQCNILGGNVVAIDEFGAEISPVLPTAFTQVIRTSSSSATIVNQTTLEIAAFDGAVTIDVLNGVPGTAYPIGTGGQPVNNLNDAKTIATTYNLRSLRVLRDLTIGATDNIDGLFLIGDGKSLSTFTFISGCSTSETTFVTAELTGVLSGATNAHFCTLVDLFGIGCTTTESNLIECEFETGTIQLRADNNKKIHISRCESGAAGTSTPPDFDFNGTVGNITFHKYAGTCQFSNLTQPIQVSFDTSGGAITINSSCTNGTVTIGGATKLVDNSGVGCDVINNTSHKLVWDHDSTIFIPDSMGAIQRRLAYHGVISVDVNNGAAGTSWPLGTATDPVNNITDATAIGIAEGIFHLEIAEDVTIGATDNVDGFIIQGSHATKSEITVVAGASTILTEFRDCQLTGTMNGQIVVRDSFTNDIFMFEGVMFQTMLTGTLSLAGTQPSYILSGYSGNTSPPGPEIDFNGTGQELVVRDYSGALKFVNKTGPESACVDFVSGKLTLDGTVTNGVITVRGTYELVDNSTGTTITRNTNLDVIEFKIDNIQTDVDVIEVTVSNMSLVIDDLIKYQRNKSIIDPIAFTLTIYEDDQVTPLTVFDLKDSAGVASVTSIFQRIPVP